MTASEKSSLVFLAGSGTFWRRPNELRGCGWSWYHSELSYPPQRHVCKIIGNLWVWTAKSGLPPDSVQRPWLSRALCCTQPHTTPGWELHKQECQSWIPISLFPFLVFEDKPNSFSLSMAPCVFGLRVMAREIFGLPIEDSQQLKMERQKQTIQTNIVMSLSNEAVYPVMWIFMIQSWRRAEEANGPTELLLPKLCCSRCRGNQPGRTICLQHEAPILHLRSSTLFILM